MNGFIDIYCERTEPGLWNEPLNAVTNIAFIIAALVATQITHRRHKLSLKTLTLIGLMFCIGLGSAAFHSFATLPTMMMDVIPILLFQICFIAFYAHDVIRLNALKTIGILGLFFLTMAGAMQLPRSWLNGSLEYAPALTFLIGLGVWHFINKKKGNKDLLIAAGLFVASLSFRSTDMALCSIFAFGTHFIWHCLNSLVLLVSYRAYMRNIDNPIRLP